MSKLIIAQLIIFYSNLYGVDAHVALAVAQHESNFNPHAMSKTDDYGVFQLHSTSFPEYSKKQLLDPTINIPLGVQYLAKMKKECIHQENINWLICFNFGIENAKRVKHPSLFPYVRSIASIMDKK